MPSASVPTGRRVRCPKCTGLLSEPSTRIYECPICATLLLANASSGFQGCEVDNEDSVEQIRPFVNGSSTVGFDKLAREDGRQEDNTESVRNETSSPWAVVLCDVNNACEGINRVLNINDSSSKKNITTRGSSKENTTTSGSKAEQPAKKALSQLDVILDHKNADFGNEGNALLLRELDSYQSDTCTAKNKCGFTESCSIDSALCSESETFVHSPPLSLDSVDAVGCSQLSLPIMIDEPDGQNASACQSSHIGYPMKEGVDDQVYTMGPIGLTNIPNDSDSLAVSESCIKKVKCGTVESCNGFVSKEADADPKISCGVSDNGYKDLRSSNNKFLIIPDIVDSMDSNTVKMGKLDSNECRHFESQEGKANCMEKLKYKRFPEALHCDEGPQTSRQHLHDGKAVDPSVFIKEDGIASPLSDLKTFTTLSQQARSKSPVVDYSFGDRWTERHYSRDSTVPNEACFCDWRLAEALKVNALEDMGEDSVILNVCSTSFRSTNGMTIPAVLHETQESEYCTLTGSTSVRSRPAQISDSQISADASRRKALECSMYGRPVVRDSTFSATPMLSIVKDKQEKHADRQTSYSQFADSLAAGVFGYDLAAVEGAKKDVMPKHSGFSGSTFKLGVNASSAQIRGYVHHLDCSGDVNWQEHDIITSGRLLQHERAVCRGSKSLDADIYYIHHATRQQKPVHSEYSNESVFPLANERSHSIHMIKQPYQQHLPSTFNRQQPLAEEQQMASKENLPYSTAYCICGLQMNPNDGVYEPYCDLHLHTGSLGREYQTSAPLLKHEGDEHSNVSLMHGASLSTKRHPPLPHKNAIPFVLCQGCKLLLLVPTILHPNHALVQKLRCGTCGKASKFSSHLKILTQECHAGHSLTVLARSFDRRLRARPGTIEGMHKPRSQYAGGTDGYAINDFDAGTRQYGGTERIISHNPLCDRGCLAVSENRRLMAACNDEDYLLMSENRRLVPGHSDGGYLPMSENGRLVPTQRPKSDYDRRMRETIGLYENSPVPEQNMISYEIPKFSHSYLDKSPSESKAKILQYCPRKHVNMGFEPLKRSQASKQGMGGHNISTSSPHSSVSCVQRLPIAGGASRFVEPFAESSTDVGPILQQYQNGKDRMTGAMSAPWSPALGSPLHDYRTYDTYSCLDACSQKDDEQTKLQNMSSPCLQDTGKGPKYYAGIFKKSIWDLGKGGQGKTHHYCNQKVVMINGYSIPESVVKRAEERAGKIQPGSYWYDYKAGFWGVMGGPCLGIIPPFIEEFKFPLPKDCASGRTDVFVNSRELHVKDLQILHKRGLPLTSGRAYMIDISGRVIDEVSGEELENMGKLAPTIEKSGRGSGMFHPGTRS